MRPMGGREACVPVALFTMPIVAITAYTSNTKNENSFFYVAAVVKPSSIFFFRAFAGRCVTQPRAVGQHSLAPRPRVSNAIPPVRVQHYHDRLTCSHCRDARDNLSLTMGKRERSPPVSDG